MAKGTIYRSPQGEIALKDIYDRQLASLDTPYHSRTVETRYGQTHLLELGKKDGTPVLLFHGGNSTNPYNLHYFKPLLGKYRIFAPDTIGHPGRSAQTQLSPKDLSYGYWAADILKALNIEKIACIGLSYGAGILVRLATVSPEKVLNAAFIVPAGIANTSIWNVLTKLGLPMIRYRLSPTKENLVKAIWPMTHRQDVDENTLTLIEAVFKHVSVHAGLPRNATREELAKFHAPALVIAAEEDVLFQGKKIIEVSEQLFPNLKETVLLPKCPHMFYLDKQILAKVHHKLDEHLSNVNN